VGKCDKRAAVLLLASYGVGVDVIAEALCLKPSTVKAYIKRYGKPAGNSPETQQKAEQPAPAPAMSSNQWIQLLRSKQQLSAQP